MYVKRKIWVFLDEINTCKSMGLISELMCKHTIQGEPLPSNIVFIAACNPYRQGKTMGKIGLNPEQVNKEKKSFPHYSPQWMIFLYFSINFTAVGILEVVGSHEPSGIRLSSTLLI